MLDVGVFGVDGEADDLDGGVFDVGDKIVIIILFDGDREVGVEIGALSDGLNFASSGNRADFKIIGADNRDASFGGFADGARASRQGSFRRRYGCATALNVGVARIDFAIDLPIETLEEIFSE